MTPAQIEATISTVRAMLDGDPLDTVHLYRSHLAIVLGALDEARADFLACAETIGVVYVADHVAPAPGPVEEVVAHIREAVRRGERAEAERDEARAALAAAEMARDVAWVRECATNEDSDAIVANVLDVELREARGMLNTIYGVHHTDADIAAAIRAARGAR